MGGFGSGRSGGRPTVEDGLTISIGEMLRRDWIRDGCSGNGNLQWSRNGECFASVGHRYDLGDPDRAYIRLNYTRTRYGEDPEKVEQNIILIATTPTYGGRRWWMLCPFTGKRVLKLHLPSGGDRFASRTAWRLGYRSQRVSEVDRIIDQLHRLQRKLGCEQGWEVGLNRPKGMQHRTFERHRERYWELDDKITASLVGRLAGIRAMIG